MNVVIDTNIVFSMLGIKEPHWLNILFANEFSFFAPNFLFVEVFNHKERIVKKSRLEPVELLEQLDLILSQIRFLPSSDISTRDYFIASKISVISDTDDLEYLALAHSLNAPLWTNDKAVRSAILKKGGIKLFNPFEEL